MTDRSLPVAHPRPATGWLNDPNGVLFHNGKWHLYFQYNPLSARHHRIVWGHLSSNDLAHWTPEPVALEPQPDSPDAYGCWSGVATIDDDGAPTLVYSGVTGDEGVSTALVVRGDSDARDFTGPRTPAASMPEDPQVIAVRDPFVFYVDGHRYAVQGAGLADGHGAILLYDATNLDRWDYLGPLLDASNPDLHGHLSASIWECPQLVPFPGRRWALMISRWVRQPDGSGALVDSQWVVGELLTTSIGEKPLQFHPLRTGMVDDGDSFYAPQALVLRERALLWGWARETRPQEDSDAAGWSGLLTWPRELHLDGDRLVTRPAPECASLRSRPLPIKPHTWNQLPDAVDLAPEASAPVIRLALGPAPESANIPSVSEAQPEVPGLVWEGQAERVVIDRSIIEIFRPGESALTLRAYPEDDAVWWVKVDGELDAWELGPWTT